MAVREKAEIIDAEGLRRIITRIAHEIVERNKGTQDLILVGVLRRGVPLAERIAAKIAEFEKIEVPQGSLDISLYRDDLSTVGPQPVVSGTTMPCELAGKVVVLVDDVLYTGRTVRAAINELFDYGRPASIALVVLVERDGRQLPICAQYAGATIEVPAGERLRLKRDAAGKLSLELERAA
jgi:pyrimidine operon attenuation protein/uracil phosphoribosyltransferase